MATSPSKEQRGWGVGIASRSEAFQAEDQPPTEGPSQLRGLWLIPPLPHSKREKRHQATFGEKEKEKENSIKSETLAAGRGHRPAPCGLWPQEPTLDAERCFRQCDSGCALASAPRPGNFSFVLFLYMRFSRRQLHSFKPWRVRHIAKGPFDCSSTWGKK